MPKFKWETEFNETELGKIPSTWAVKKIGEVAAVSTDGTPSRQIESYWNGDVNWLRSQEVNYEYIYSAEEKITELGRRNSNAKNLLPAGTVVVALIGGTTGKVAMLRIDSTINQNLAAIQGRPNLANSQFVFFYLKMSRERLLQSAHGGAQANLNLDLVREVILPVPEFTEQSWIASVLSWFDDQIQNLKNRTSS